MVIGAFRRHRRHLSAGIDPEGEWLPHSASSLDQENQFRAHADTAGRLQLSVRKRTSSRDIDTVPILTSCRVSGGWLSRYWSPSSQPIAKIATPRGVCRYVPKELPKFVGDILTATHPAP